MWHWWDGYLFNSNLIYMGFSNGDIFLQYSWDSGATWIEPINLTNSPSPGCAAGDCDSDHWSSIAETVDDSLYIIYIEDKDAGGIPFDEGIATTNPVKYLAYPRPTIFGVDEDGTLPSILTLSQNYPNPFNASTSINYSLLEQSDVTIEIYDVLGRAVETIDEGNKPAGEHRITWNADDQTSGIYFYSIQAGDFSKTKRMVLLK